MAYEYVGPRGFKVQTGIHCCANCDFGGYLGGKMDNTRMCTCEIFGPFTDGCPSNIAVEPLAICDAFKAKV